VETVEATDYQPGEMQFQLAAFLYRRGRADEAAQYAEQARQSVRKLGPESPRIAFVEQQISAVIESARSGRC
jgi:hypothetical protein